MKSTFIILAGLLLYSCDKGLEEQIKYYSSGKIKERTFVDDQKRVQGTSYTYFENGNIQTKSENLDDQMNGLFEEYYSNGKLKVRAHFLHAVEIDSTLFYSETGNLETILIYDQKGNRQKEIHYYPNGKIKEESALLVGKGEFVASKKYAKTGKVIEDLSEGSLGYTDLKYSKSSKGNLVLKIDLKNNPYTDSLTLSIVKDFDFDIFNDPKIVRKVSYPGSNSLTIEILNSDYNDNRLNLIVETIKYKDAAKKHSLIKQYYIQLPQKGKMPKDNVIGIYPK